MLAFVSMTTYVFPTREMFLLSSMRYNRSLNLRQAARNLLLAGMRRHRNLKKAAEHPFINHQVQVWKRNQALMQQRLVVMVEDD